MRNCQEVFTTETRSTQSSEYFLRGKLFPPRSQRLHGGFSDSLALLRDMLFSVFGFISRQASLALSMTYVASGVIVFSFSVGVRKIMSHFVVKGFSDAAQPH